MSLYINLIIVLIFEEMWRDLSTILLLTRLSSLLYLMFKNHKQCWMIQSVTQSMTSTIMLTLASHTNACTFQNKKKKHVLEMSEI